jgi:mediator of RNA polymerase II transcription subunit 5
MSLLELSRNSFQSGLSAQKWAALSRLFISKNSEARDHEDLLQYELCNSVLVLFGSYPGDPGLRGYLEQALKDSLISLPVYITAMLQAARTSDLQNLWTVDVLCRIALLFSSTAKMSPLTQSAILLDNSAASVSTKVLDALALVNFCRSSLSNSSIHPALESSSQLVVLLLSCLTDISQVDPTHCSGLKCSRSK